MHISVSSYSLETAVPGSDSLESGAGNMNEWFWHVGKAALYVKVVWLRLGSSSLGVAVVL